MAWERPAPNRVWQAIEVYLSLAYEGLPPSAIVARLTALRECGENRFYASETFERDGEPEPSRFALRLGNRFYPHAKLVIESAPDGRRAFFHADTHDRHCCPDLGSPEYPIFHQLMEQNQKIAWEVERAWAREGLPTFRQSLRQDHERRIRAG